MSGKYTGKPRDSMSKAKVKSSIYHKKSVQSYPVGQMRRA